MTTETKVQKWRRLRAGETIRKNDMLSATANQGKRTWKEWTSQMTVPEGETFAIAGGWCYVDESWIGTKVNKNDILTYARPS